VEFLAIAVAGGIPQAHALPVGSLRVDTAKASCAPTARLARRAPGLALLTCWSKTVSAWSRGTKSSTIWMDAIVSDAGIASRIKSARQALVTTAGTALHPDDPRPGLPLRREVRVARAMQLTDPPPLELPLDSRRHCRRGLDRVQPFRLVGDPGPYAAIAGRPAPRTDHGAVAPALAVRHRTWLVVSPALRRRRHARNRSRARVR